MSLKRRFYCVHHNQVKLIGYLEKCDDYSYRSWVWDECIGLQYNDGAWLWRAIGDIGKTTIKPPSVNQDFIKALKIYRTKDLDISISPNSR